MLLSLLWHPCRLWVYYGLHSDLDRVAHCYLAHEGLAGKVELLEQELSSYSEKMLMSVATRYGKNSLQYMQAGG